MLRHGIEARRGRNRLLAGSVHESPAPKGDARQDFRRLDAKVRKLPMAEWDALQTDRECSFGHAV